MHKRRNSKAEGVLRQAAKPRHADQLLVLMSLADDRRTQSV